MGVMRLHYHILLLGVAAALRPPPGFPRAKVVASSSAPSLAPSGPSLLRRVLSLGLAAPSGEGAGLGLSEAERHAVISSHPKYGTDPRAAVLDESHMVDDREWSTGTPGQVNELWGGVAQFQAALDAARQRDALVVVKFRRHGCAACKSTVELMSEAARSYADSVVFWEVDYHGCKSYCQRAVVKVVPCVHIYGGDALLHVAGLSKSKWDPFIDHLQELLAGGSTADAHGLLHDHESNSPEETVDQRLEEAMARSRLF